jgi:predicted AAA+ superfamily ATPase
MAELKDTVLRKNYIEKVAAGRDMTDVAKIITGIRRCGKSTLMMQYMEHLRNSGVDDDRIFYMNLEDEANLHITDHLQLRDIMKERIRKDVRMYVFLDEIQRVTGWEMNLNALMASYDADVYITGSNAHLLSSELATYISGRYVEIKMLPLSFEEYLELHPSSVPEEVMFDKYLKYGALPLVDPNADNDFIIDLLHGIYNTVLVKDVLSRKGIRNMDALERMTRFIFSNIGNQTNVHTISQLLNMPPMTVGGYLTALEEAYLLYKADRYDVRRKNILTSNEKYYTADLGIRNAKIGWRGGPDTGRQLENVVYLELRRRGYDVMVGSFKDAEVDFTAFKGDKIEYYQVTKTMLEDITSKREIRSLMMIPDNYPKTILSLDRVMVNPGNGIMHMNLLDWLLGREAP